MRTNASVGYGAESPTCVALHIRNATREDGLLLFEMPRRFMYGHVDLLISSTAQFRSPVASDQPVASTTVPVSTCAANAY